MAGSKLILFNWNQDSGKLVTLHGPKGCECTAVVPYDMWERLGKPESLDAWNQAFVEYRKQELTLYVKENNVR